MEVTRSCLNPDDIEVDEGGTEVAINGVVRDSFRDDAVSEPQGFTFIEVLVVVAIIGLISTMVMVSLNSYWQRSRLEGGANDVRSFLLTAQDLAIATNDRVTVTLQKIGSSWVLEMLPERPPTPGSVLDLGVRRRMELPAHLVVNGLTLGDGTDWVEYPANVHNVVCTSRSRTQQQTAAKVFGDIPNTRVLRLTHESIVEGRLSPRTVFEIQISPLWNVRMLKRRAA